MTMLPKNKITVCEGGLLRRSAIDKKLPEIIRLSNDESLLFGDYEQQTFNTEEEENENEMNSNELNQRCFK